MGAPVIEGTTLPDVDRWSDRVVVALGQNPSLFSGPGTNTYLVGTGKRRILVDPGQGVPAYLDVLERAMREHGCEGIQEIVLTHGHPDHLMGVPQMLERFGDLRISKLPYPDFDSAVPLSFERIEHGDVVRTEGASLRAVHTPGHAPDHLCFVLEEEQTLFSGDNVLGIGTTVIPDETGSLADYMRSLERMREEQPRRIYPAHGPVIDAGIAKIDEYIAHRRDRERQIVAVLETGPRVVMEIVEVVYAAYPKKLHAPAAQSVTQHLRALESEGRARGEGEGLLERRWSLI